MTAIAARCRSRRCDQMAGAITTARNTSATMGQGCSEHIAFPSRNTLGDFLKARREELRHSRESLVSKILMSTGYRISVCHYFRIERGVRMPSADALDKIADGLNINRSERIFVHSLLVEKIWPRPVMLQETVPEQVCRSSWSMAFDRGHDPGLDTRKPR